MDLRGLTFKNLIFCDTEYIAPPGELPRPISLAADCLLSNRKWRLWEDELRRLREPPFPIDEDTLFISYNSPAELGCFHVLGWNSPANILDLYPEFLNIVNGIPLKTRKRDLVTALRFFKLPTIDPVRKDQMRQLIMSGGPWSGEEIRAIMSYNEEDIVCLPALTRKILSRADIRHCLLRGIYMSCVSRMNHLGVPIDIDSFNLVSGNWDYLQKRLVEEVDQDFGCYDGTRFVQAKFERFVDSLGLNWPRTETGRLKTDQDSFRSMSRIEPRIAPLKELRSTLGKMRLRNIPIGSDGRHRANLWPFGTKTSRHRTSSAGWIFGPSVWVRFFIQAPPGKAIVYADFSQQEFMIGACLSQDPNMLEDIKGDAYLGSAVRAGAAPSDATKESHARERAIFKEVSLATLYGMGPALLASKIDRSIQEARELLRWHRKAYSKYWDYSDSVVAEAYTKRKINTCFGWQFKVYGGVNERTLRNWPIQSTGAEMLRLAICLAFMNDIAVVGPVHDAMICLVQLDELDEKIATIKRVMGDASAMILDGVRVKVDTKVFRYPERFVDERGRKMWDTIWRLLGR